MKVDRRTAIKTSLVTGLGLLLTGRSIADECLTTPDIVGPYYIPGSPVRSKLAPNGAPGTKLFITGSVYAKDCETPLKNAVVDVWHANDDGGYHDADYRGIIKTDSSGKYAFETVLPGKYLNGSYYRPRHLHYKVSAPDIDPNLVLTTQIYFEGDTSIPQDPWASDPDAADRIIPLSADQQNAEHGVADFVIDVDQPMGLQEHGDQKTMIQAISPNPVVNSANIIIALNSTGQADLKIFDLFGREVNCLWNQKWVNGGSHHVALEPLNKHGLRLRQGVYIIKLWLNGEPKDAKRFIIA